MRLLDRIRERLATWDAAAARKALRRFEADHGLDLRRPRVALVDVEALVRAVRPEDRPVVEHHWASWCAPCLPELPVIQGLAERLGSRADVVGVVWDRFQPDEADPAATRARIAEICAAQRLAFPNVVFDGPPEALFDALGLGVHEVPLTRVVDTDGGVLRVIAGPLRPADIEGLAALLGAG